MKPSAWFRTTLFALAACTAQGCDAFDFPFDLPNCPVKPNGSGTSGSSGDSGNTGVSDSSGISDSSGDSGNTGDEDPNACANLEVTGVEAGQVAPGVILRDGEGRSVNTHEFCDKTVLLIAGSMF